MFCFPFLQKKWSGQVNSVFFSQKKIRSGLVFPSFRKKKRQSTLSFLQKKGQIRPGQVRTCLPLLFLFLFSHKRPEYIKSGRVFFPYPPEKWLNTARSSQSFRKTDQVRSDLVASSLFEKRLGQVRDFSFSFFGFLRFQIFGFYRIFDFLDLQDFPDFKRIFLSHQISQVSETSWALRFLRFIEFLGLSELLRFFELLSFLSILGVQNF